MAKHAITLDRRTLIGKNVFNFLVGMKYIDEETPDVAEIDERTKEGKDILGFLCRLGVIRPYNEEFVKKIEKSREEARNGLRTEITDIDAL